MIKRLDEVDQKLKTIESEMKRFRKPIFKKQEPKKGLKEIIQENDLYEDVISQLSQRLALREAITKA